MKMGSIGPSGSVQHRWGWGLLAVGGVFANTLRKLFITYPATSYQTADKRCVLRPRSFWGFSKGTRNIHYPSYNSVLSYSCSRSGAFLNFVEVEVEGEHKIFIFFRSGSDLKKKTWKKGSKACLHDACINTFFLFFVVIFAFLKNHDFLLSFCVEIFGFR